MKRYKYHHQRYLPPLIILCVVFTFRVVGQLAQKVYSFSFLPPFDAWHSNSIPYSWLLFSQISIVVIMILVIVKFLRKSISPNNTLGPFLRILGVIYFGLMACRLAIGLFILRDHFWFGAIIPTFFHLILAGFVLVVANFHCQKRQHSDQLSLSNE